MCGQSAIIYASDFRKCKEMLDGLDMRVLHEFPFINAFGVCCHPRDISEIASLLYVKNIAPQTTAYTLVDAAREVMNIRAMHGRGIFGEGVTLAVIDTGVYPHLDFMVPQPRLLEFVDFIDGKEEPYDDNGHGTFVAAVACGNGVKSCGKYKGIAPRAGLIALRAMNKKGEGGAFGILQAMQWVFDNAESYGIKVCCMSFGSSVTGADDPLIEGAEALWKKGIVVVAAAGNNGPEAHTIKSPGASSLIITVGAMHDGREEGESGAVRTIRRQFMKDYKVAEFSSRGPVGNLVKPDIVAPAVDIISASNDDKLFYSKMSGTSVAVPLYCVR